LVAEGRKPTGFWANKRIIGGLAPFRYISGGEVILGELPKQRFGGIAMESTLAPPGTFTGSKVVAPDELVHFLHRPESYGDGTASVSFRETHISWVALTDRRVYKVKKPVRFPFLDYSTLELRLHACREELRLGRRLAMDVYLGLVPITGSPRSRLQFGGDGPVVDYSVVMKRLPEARMLDRLVREKTATHTDIERLLNVLVPFYSSAVRGPDIDQYATAAAIERQGRENLATIDATDHGLPGSLFKRVRASQLQFLKLSAARFAERVRSGRVCEGHGDLRPEHVCMVAPPVVFDCVEFSLPLRSADVISELAFLAMELDFLGVPELATALMEGYKVRAKDAVPDALVNFYKSYRACIRAKVDLLRADQLAELAADHARAHARRYLQLASYYATEFYRPKLFVMVGAAGTGKSTVADALADALGLEVLRTDTIRHALAGRREPDSDVGHGIYSDTMTQRTYSEIFSQAEALLHESLSVVLDGTFRDSTQRNRAVDLARRNAAEVHFVYCRSARALAHQRIADRIARRDGISDARPEIHDVQQEELDATADWSNLPVIALDTSRSAQESVAQVIGAMCIHGGRC
jgi:aminoglycoside phosphotransferase family enzyme/predicted kinase